MKLFKKCDSTNCNRKIPAHIAHCCIACAQHGKHNQKCNEHYDYFGDFLD